MQPIVQLKDVKKQYASKEAVKGISLDIRKGELFTLLGANGAGKTTTLKMTVGLLRPTSGSVLIGGIDMHKEPMKAKRLTSFVPDVPYVYDKLTPRELLRFVGKLYNMNARDIQTKGEELLRFFDIEHVENTLIEEFSHGMKQKAILASALVHDPAVFILDEPMIGLDPVSIRSFKDYLKAQVRNGMTVIFSTHTLSTAEELADRIGIIHQGKLIAVGTLAELKEKYQSKENLEIMFTELVKSGFAQKE